MFHLKSLGINFNRAMSPPSSPKSDRSGKSDMSSNLPKAKNYSTPQDYAKAMEEHFGHDMAKLSHYVKDLPDGEQTAVIDGSKAFREYLGIRNPERFSQKLGLPSSSSRNTNCIPINEAPDVLAMAATKSGNEGRVMRSLERLGESLEKIKENKMPLTYRPLILPALNQLAKGLGNLKTEAALAKAVKILEKEQLIFDSNTVKGISSFAQNISGNQHINKDLKENLLKLGNANVDESNWKNAEIAFKKRTSNREKAPYVSDIYPTKPSSSLDRHLNEITRSPNQQQHRLDGSSKQAALVNLPKIPAERLHMANTLALGEGVLFKTRLLENNDEEPGRVAIFGMRFNISTQVEVDLSAPFTRGLEQMELGMMNSFVRCADGEIRRFPGTFDANPTFKSQIKSGMIYDSDKKHIVTCVAGYKFNSKDGTGAFEVEGVKQKPVFKDGNIEVYKLGKNRHMVPQPNFRSCTYACENMLLMDQGYLRPDKPLIMPDTRRESPEILKSIKQNTRGVDPIVFEISLDPKKTNSAAIKDLKNKIEKFGPCLFTIGGHDRMLDEIQEKNGKFFFTIRDPFHGTCNVVEGLNPLLISDMRFKNDNKKTLRAFFLPRKTDFDAPLSTGIA